MNIEYELENEGVTLHDVVISIPLPYVAEIFFYSTLRNLLSIVNPFIRSGSYPTVSSHSGDWSLNPSSHSLDWTIPAIDPQNRSGSLEFTVGGDDAGAFFPVKVAFVGQGSMAGVAAANITRIDNGEEATFSVDSIVTADSYLVV